MVRPAEALVIDVTYDASVATSGFSSQITADVGSVVSAFESAISNNVTVNIGVGWGGLAAQTSRPATSVPAPTTW
jgi:xanthine dehydrogenase iron-sulfur cluster and FAD-binding subunit A